MVILTDGMGVKKEASMQIKSPVLVGVRPAVAAALEVRLDVAAGLLLVGGRRRLPSLL